ncbi:MULTISPECIES: hypothetical protein [Cysteiniphilum]|uniref:Uncharacterized protein n=1 Tax=Cysteiniphilum litorale TaxID=2056700 RepID=A0A8J3E852_9GAMM|nr:MULTISPECIES: hypothetical protein [Cysteiniphilum]GGF92191.1 hypothetical protein GCM10010995_06720 [Cysteiniphilum litorale]
MHVLSKIILYVYLIGAGITLIRELIYSINHMMSIYKLRKADPTIGNRLPMFYLNIKRPLLWFYYLIKNPVRFTSEIILGIPSFNLVPVLENKKWYRKLIARVPEPEEFTIKSIVVGVTRPINNEYIRNPNYSQAYVAYKGDKVVSYVNTLLGKGITPCAYTITMTEYIHLIKSGKIKARSGEINLEELYAALSEYTDEHVDFTCHKVAVKNNQIQ